MLRRSLGGVPCPRSFCVLGCATLVVTLLAGCSGMRKGSRRGVDGQAYGPPTWGPTTATPFAPRTMEAVRPGPRVTTVAPDGGPAGPCIVHFRIINNSGFPIAGGTWDAAGQSGSILPSGPLFEVPAFTADCSQCSGSATVHLQVPANCPQKPGTVTTNDQGVDECTIEVVIDPIPMPNCH